MREIKNIVASLGTALTPEQIRLIKRYTSRVILVYDSDKAGKAAALRSLDLLLENDLKAEVVELPSGYDPDSLVRKEGRDYFKQLLDKRLDFFDYKLAALKSAYDIDSIDGKSKIAKELFTTINKLNSEIQKYEYIKKLSLKLGVKEEVMIAEFQKHFPKNSKISRKAALGQEFVYKDSSNSLAREPLSITEKVIFKFMFTAPKAFSLIRKNLKEDYFTSYLARKTIAFLFKTYSDQESPSIQNMLGVISDKEISGFISQVLINDDIPLNKDIFKESLIKLRKKGLVQLKKELKVELQQAESVGDGQKVKELIKKHSRLALQ